MSNHNITGIPHLLLDNYFHPSDSVLESAQGAAKNVRSKLKIIKDLNFNHSQKISECEKLYPTIQQCITTFRNAQHNRTLHNNDEFKNEFLRILATESNITVFQSDCAKKILQEEWTKFEPTLDEINSIDSKGAGDSEINDINTKFKNFLNKIEKANSSAMQIFRFQHKTLIEQLDQYKTIVNRDEQYLNIIKDNLNAARINVLYFSAMNSGNKAAVSLEMLKHIKLGDSKLVEANTALQECSSYFEKMLDKFQEKLNNSYFQNGTQPTDKEKITTCIDMIGECHRTIHAAHLLSKLYKDNLTLQPYRDLCTGIKNDFTHFDSNIRFEFSHLIKQSNVPHSIHNFELRNHLEKVKKDTNELTQHVIKINPDQTALATQKDQRTFVYELTGELTEYKQGKKQAWKKVSPSEGNGTRQLAPMESQEKINALSDTLEATTITDETDLLILEIEEHIGRLKDQIISGKKQEVKCELYEKNGHFEYPATLFNDFKNKLESVYQNASKLLDSYESVKINQKKQSDFENILQTQLDTAITFIQSFRDRRVNAIKDQKNYIDKTCLKLLLNYGEIRSLTKTVSKKPLAEKIGNSGDQLNPGFLDVHFIDINAEKKLELHVHYENSDDTVPISGAIHLKYPDKPNLERDPLKLSIDFFNQLFSNPGIKKIDTTKIIIDSR